MYVLFCVCVKSLYKCRYIYLCVCVFFVYGASEVPVYENISVSDKNVIFFCIVKQIICVVRGTYLCMAVYVCIHVFLCTCM